MNSQQLRRASPSEGLCLSLAARAHAVRALQSLLEPPPIPITTDVWQGNTDALIIGVGVPGGVDPASGNCGRLYPMHLSLVLARRSGARTHIVVLSRGVLLLSGVLSSASILSHLTIRLEPQTRVLDSH